MPLMTHKYGEATLTTLHCRMVAVAAAAESATDNQGNIHNRNPAAAGKLRSQARTAISATSVSTTPVAASARRIATGAACTKGKRGNQGGFKTSKSAVKCTPRAVANLDMPHFGVRIAPSTGIRGGAKSGMKRACEESRQASSHTHHSHRLRLRTRHHRHRIPCISSIVNDG